MANKYFVNGGGTLDWSTAANWATTSGGAGGAGFTTGDDVFFDASSPNMTSMNSARSCASATFTGYTNTFTLDQTLTITGAGGCTLVSGMTLSGSGTILLSTTSQSFTSAGKTIPNFNLTNTITITLNDDVNVSGTMTFGTSGVVTTVNGNTIYCSGHLTVGYTTGRCVGTTAIILNGTGTWSGSGTGTNSGGMGLNVTINTAGTITLSGSGIYISGTLTYTAGTVITTGSTVTSSTSVAGATFNCAAIMFENMLLASSVTHTLTNTLNIRGLLTIGATSSATVINSSQINVYGGVRFNGTTGIITGTTTIHLIGSQTFDAPSRTTGRFEIACHFNAPGGIITVGTGVVGFDLSNFKVAPGTIISNVSGYFPTVGLLPINNIWLE